MKSLILLNLVLKQYFKDFPNKNDNENKGKDTFILTKIIEPFPKSTSQLDNINFIKDELSIVKSMLSKQEKTLESILLKIK